MKKYPFRFICGSVSDCEWVYHNYKDLISPLLFRLFKESVMTDKKTQIIVNSKKQISWCRVCEEHQDCAYIKSPGYCEEEKKLHPTKVKNIRREEILRRILNV